MKIFSRAELEHVFKLDTVALGVIRNGFVALAEDRVVMPPILSMDVAENNGEVDVKTAYMKVFRNLPLRSVRDFLTIQNWVCRV